MEWRDAATFINSVGLNGHFGQTHTPYVAAFDDVLAKLSSLGVRHLREDLGQRIRKGRDDPQFVRLRAAAAAGFRFSLVCFDGINTAAVTDPASVPSLFDWCDGAVEQFEGSNEPKIVGIDKGGDRSASHQRALYNAVRSSSELSDVKVLGPSYVDAQVPLAKNVSDAVDFGNIHPYPGYEEPETQGRAGLQRRISDVREIFGGKPVMVTETGYHTALESPSGHLPVPPSIKARYLPRLLLWYFMNGLQRTYVYEGVSSFPTTRTNAESAFGLLNSDLSETPSYAALRNLMSAVATTGQPVAPRPLDLSVISAPADLACVGLLRGDGVRLLAFWRARRGWDGHHRLLLPRAREPFQLRVSRDLQRLRLLRIGDDGQVETTSPSMEGRRLDTFADDNLALAVMS